jgi:hypothetical protein
MSSLIELAKNKYVQLAIAFLAGGATIYQFSREETISSSFEEDLKKQNEQIKSEFESKEKSLTENLSKKEEEFKKEKEALKSEYESKITKLSSENLSLKKRTRKEKVVVVNKDGGREEKTVETSEEDSTSSKIINEVTEQLQKVTREKEAESKRYSEEIKSLKESHSAQLAKIEEKRVSEEKRIAQEVSKTIADNKKRFGVGLSKFYKSEEWMIQGHWNILPSVFVQTGVKADPKKLKESKFSIGAGVNF